MNKKYLVLFLIVFIGGLIIGFLSGKVLEEKKVDPNNTFKAGWEAAQKRLEETGTYFQINNKAPVKILSGTVTKIRADKIYLKVAPLSPLADRDLDERIIRKNKETKIYKIIKKPENQYQLELDKFYKENPTAANKANLEIPKPSPFDKMKVSFSEIKIGQTLSVESNIDIRNQKEIIAKEIIIQY